MRIALFCDIHLPYHTNAGQYDVFKWILEDILSKKPDAVVFNGDYTADGDINAARFFVNKMRELPMPVLISNGNAEYRKPETISEIRTLQSENFVTVGDCKILSLHDGEGSLTEEEYSLLSKADAKTIVCMHHPIERMPEPHNARLSEWRDTHLNTALFYGHLHRSEKKDNTYYLQAADPDKAIGENPCIHYYDTDTRILDKSVYLCPMPEDFTHYVGISCYRPIEDIEYCIEHKLGCLELRPNVVSDDIEKISELLGAWRMEGGWNLSMHAPNLTYADGSVTAKDEDIWNKFIEVTNVFVPDRITLHVPIIPIKVMREDPYAMDCIVDFLVKKISKLPCNCIVGVENMHVRPEEKDEDARRFGYLPDELRHYMLLLRKKADRYIGVNLDVGHARNNIPFSQKYTISTWYAELGNETVGYHLHQVIKTGKGGNHFPITHWNGRLISYASFFCDWSKGKLNHVPVIFEIRPGSGEHHVYAPTIELCGK